MKTKQLLLLLPLSLFLAFSGCTDRAETPLQDGTYSVRFDEPDSTDWIAVMSLTIEDQKILSVDYDYEGTGANEGRLKSEDTAYNEAMFSTKGTKPTIYLQELEDALLLHQDPDKVDTVSGATTSSEDFRTFVIAALEAARQGKTEPIIIPQVN